MGNEYKKVISEKKREAERLMTDEQLTACNVAIHTAALATAAEGFIPLPGVDAVPMSITQITMVLALGKVFEQKISESAAKALIGTTATTFIGRNLIKVVPVVGWAVSSVVAAGVTEAMGWTIAVNFANSYKNDIKNRKNDNDELDEIINKACAAWGSVRESLDNLKNIEEPEEPEDPDNESIEKEFEKEFEKEISED